jgi:hypothetical protein
VTIKDVGCERRAERMHRRTERRRGPVAGGRGGDDGPGTRDPEPDLLGK